MKHVHPLKLETKQADDSDPVKAVEEFLAAFGEFRTKNDERITELEKASGTKLIERLDKIEAKLNRPNGRENKSDEPSLERKAFTAFLRGGRETLSADETKSLIVGDDVKGGYLAPAEFVAEVIKGITEASPVRQAARVGATSAGSVILPSRTGKPTAHWVGETEDRSETGSTYGQIEIPVHEAACYVDVSLRLLEDAAVNVESEVAADVAEEFGRIEGAAFVNGDGLKKPTGIMSESIPLKANGHATNLQADGLITLAYSLPAPYRNRASWMMNGSTLAAVRKLKDGTTGTYLWQPSFQAGQPETILGRPVIEAPDMPDIEDGSFPILFGDFKSGYRIYDRLALSVMRDPYSQAIKGLVRFHARRRVGGGTVLIEAFRQLHMATS